ncbi:hypothetical protein ACIQK6_30855 [Streptomyces sp. NPDC091682]|uniref:hypothetical protein n=1 Tax=Streptomyces sp. NPDC091682 TaxID=3366005 RepID=UPI00382B6775
MLNRTALTTAVTSSTPEPESRPAQDNLVFGKVARPGGNHAGALAQDVDLFNATLPLPRIPGDTGPHARNQVRKTQHVRNAARSGVSRTTGSKERIEMPLPLLLSGALAAGILMAVGLTFGTDRSPDGPALAMPELPPPSATPDTEPPATPHTPTPPTTVTAAPTKLPAP